MAHIHKVQYAEGPKPLTKDNDIRQLFIHMVQHICQGVIKWSLKFSNLGHFHIIFKQQKKREIASIFVLKTWNFGVQLLQI